MPRLSNSEVAKIALRIGSRYLNGWGDDEPPYDIEVTEDENGNAHARWVTLGNYDETVQRLSIAIRMLQRSGWRLVRHDDPRIADPPQDAA